MGALCCRGHISREEARRPLYLLKGFGVVGLTGIWKDFFFFFLKNKKKLRFNMVN